jgi:hypothetical protein
MNALRIVLGLAAALFIALVIVDFAADGLENVNATRNTTAVSR